LLSRPLPDIVLGMTSGAAVVSGHTPDGRRLTVCVPYAGLPGYAAPIEAAWSLAYERLGERLAEIESGERLTGRWACCGGEIASGRHAEACSAAHVDGTPK
jgi:hypothetical protein